jgi:hypothetical protein
MEEIEIRQILRGTRTINIANNDISYLIIISPLTLMYRIEITKEELKNFIDSPFDKKEYENWIRKNIDRIIKIN